MMFKNIVKCAWRSFSNKDGLLKVGAYSDIKACEIANLVILSDPSICIYVEDCGGYKEVELQLRLSEIEPMGWIRQDNTINIVNFPDCCRMNLFLNQKLKVQELTEKSVNQNPLKGIVFINQNNLRLGFFIDEKRPLNIIVTTDDDSLNILTRQYSTLDNTIDNTQP